jgi:hypothetical protein
MNPNAIAIITKIKANEKFKSKASKRRGKKRIKRINSH